MKLKRIVLIFTILVISYSNLFSQKISKEDKLYYYSMLWSEMKYNFAHIDKIDFNIDSLYKSNIKKVLNTKTDLEYYKLLDRFLAKFKDGHTQIFYQSIFRNKYIYSPLAFKDFRGEIYLVAYNKTKAIADDSFVGSKVIKINGMEPMKFIKKNIYPYISASTEGNRFKQAVKLINNTLYSKTISLENKKHKTKIIELNKCRYNPKEKKTFGKYIPIKNFEYKKFGDIAYVKIRNFNYSSKLINFLKTSFETIAKSKAVIIDLRDNTGGDSSIATNVGALFREGNRYVSNLYTTRISNACKKSQGSYIKRYKDFFESKSYSKVISDTANYTKTFLKLKSPCCILVNQNTYSAGEDMLISLYYLKGRPTIIGNETAGSTGAPLVLPKFPLGAIVRICTKKQFYPHSMVEFHGKGVTPDIIVNPSIEDYFSDKDPYIEKAIEVLKKKMKK